MVLKKKLAVFASLSIFFSPILAQAQKADYKYLHSSDKIIEAHQKVCAQMGGIDLSDLHGANLKVTKGTLDALVCGGIPENNSSHTLPRAGIYTFNSKNPKPYIHTLSNNDIGHWDFSSTKVSIDSPNDGLTLTAPNGSVIYNQNFEARAVLTYNNLQGQMSTVHVGVPADKCSAEYGGQNPPSPLWWMVLCNASVIGAAQSYASYDDYIGDHAKSNGFIIQHN